MRILANPMRFFASGFVPADDLRGKKGGVGMTQLPDAILGRSHFEASFEVLTKTAQIVVSDLPGNF